MEESGRMKTSVWNYSLMNHNLITALRMTPYTDVTCFTLSYTQITLDKSCSMFTPKPESASSESEYHFTALFPEVKTESVSPWKAPSWKPTLPETSHATPSKSPMTGFSHEELDVKSRFCCHTSSIRCPCAIWGSRACRQSLSAFLQNPSLHRVHFKTASTSTVSLSCSHRPDRTADRDFSYIQTQRQLRQETEVILHKSI